LLRLFADVIWIMADFTDVITAVSEVECHPSFPMLSATLTRKQRTADELFSWRSAQQVKCYAKAGLCLLFVNYALPQVFSPNGTPILSSCTLQKKGSC